MPGTLPLLREVPHGDWVNAVAFSPDGKLLASACRDGKLRVITPGDGVVVHSGLEPMAVNPFWLHCGPDLRRSYLH